MPMSKLEIVIICIAAAIPVIVLLWFIPKRKGKVKKAKEETKPVQQEEVKFELSKEDTNPKDKVRVFENKNLSAKELEDILKSKAATTSKPVKNPDRPDFSMPFPDFMSYQEAKARAKNSKPIAEQIKELSPELKALLLTGALNDKKH